MLLTALLLTATPALKVGTTLHPYYSWTSNIAQGQNVEVRAVLPSDTDVGNYQPRPADIAKLKDLDALVINGIGHDDFIEGMLKASGNTRCRIIRANDGTALLKNLHGEGVNSHTFLSITNAITQTYFIARALGEMRPELNAAFQSNASAYAKRLRALKADAMKRLVNAKETKVITVHDGYSYLLQELGLELVAVVEPSHGLTPSAAELGEIVSRIKRDHVKVVLSEESFPRPMNAVLGEAGATVTVISHIAIGAFTPARFESEMQTNLNALVKATGAP